MDEELIVPREIESGKPQGFYQKYKRSLWTGLVSLTLLTAGLVAWILFFRDTKPKETYQGDVQVLVGAPRSAPSGSQISYEVVIDNRSNATLTNLALEVFYPSGFEFLDSSALSEPADENFPVRQFNFSDLAPGKQEKLTIIGTLSGSVQEVKIFNAKLHYVPSNFRSEFVAEGSSNTVVLAPEISMSLSAPTSLFSGQNIIYDIRLTNVSEKDFANLIISASYPEKFEFKEAKITATNGGQKSENPMTAEDDGTWKVDQLRLRESKEISITGSLLEESGKESFIQAELFLLDSNGERVSAGRAYAFTQIAPPPLVLTHKLVSVPPDELISGTKLDYEIDYENISQVGLHNVILTMFFETAVFDFSKMEIGSGQFKNNALTWIPAGSPELSAVSPGQKGKFKFTVPISDRLSAELKKNPEVKTRVSFEADELPEAISGNILDFRIQTQVVLSVSAQAAGGDNSLVLGKETTYRVELKLSNTVNDVKDAVFEAVIPRAETNFDLSSLTPNEEAKEVEFNKTSGTFRWKVGRIFALSGDFHEPRILSFNLTVTPGVGESIYSLPLLRDLIVTGTDEFTNKKISSNKIELLIAR